MKHLREIYKKWFNDGNARSCSKYKSCIYTSNMQGMVKIRPMHLHSI